MPNAHPTRFTAGIGMAIGAVAGAIVALVVQLVTGDAREWAYAIPIGIAVLLVATLALVMVAAVPRGSPDGRAARHGGRARASGWAKVGVDAGRALDTRDRGLDCARYVGRGGPRRTQPS